MQLRSELLPPPVNEQQLQAIGREIERIANLIQHGEPADEAIAVFNRSTGHHYGMHDFAEYQGSRDLADFALEAARPAHPRVPDITRYELIEVVDRILAADPETDYYLRLLDANLAHPDASGLIFHPPAELRDASAEQIIDHALSYRPIAM
ncbi:hypothetical protein GCM10009550_69450 [Actinocorallia libanotica]|uniref:Colicin immunity protein/pyocin immunity protein n=2 Tax=Actinocorallia libanotica TaxID=46162 RepID=A0ABN1RWV3_9ACTN